MTLHDEIWNTALTLAHQGKSFTREDLQLSDSESISGLRVLREMTRHEWLSFDREASRWSPGWKITAKHSEFAETAAPRTIIQCSKCGGDILPDDSYVDIRRMEQSADNAPPRVRYTIWCVDCDGNTPW